VLRRAALVVVVALALTSCAPESGSTAGPAAGPSARQPSTILPTVPGEMTTDSVQSETVRIADELIASIDPARIVNDDEYSQEVAAEAGAYWGVLHTLTLQPSIDAAAVAEQIAGRMTDAGWIARDGTNQDGTYLIALSSSEDAATSWFCVVGADASVPGDSVVTLQLASPPIG
jgi:hypothetical protein